MKENKKGEFRSRVYTERPKYADYDSAEKFQAIQGIIITKLKWYPKAICSYSGGSDSDILIDMIERARGIFPNLPPVKYVFFNTGLEMKATKDHVKEVAEKYGVEIEEVRPKKSIVTAVKENGQPFLTKALSQRISDLQKKEVPLSIYDEYQNAENKFEKWQELQNRYPKCRCIVNSILGTTAKGELGTNTQLHLSSRAYLLDFLQEYPPEFKISDKCCGICKKEPAHRIQKDCDLIITGERFAEGGVRTTCKPMQATDTQCFYEQSDGKRRFRPLYYVADKDKAWYKDYYGIRYSDAYEVYGLTRTGCCGCPISYKAVEDLEKIRPYEPNVVKAAWNIFGDSYRYRQQYVEYKEKRKAEDKAKKEAAKKTSV